MESRLKTPTVQTSNLGMVPESCFPQAWSTAGGRRMFHGPTPRTLGLALILTLKNLSYTSGALLCRLLLVSRRQVYGDGLSMARVTAPSPQKILLAKLLQEGCRQCSALGDSDSQQVPVLCNEGSHSSGTTLQVKITKLGLKKWTSRVRKDNDSKLSKLLKSWQQKHHKIEKWDVISIK